MKKLSLILGLIVLLIACKKEKFPEPTVSKPVFELQANIDGEAVLLQGGVDDYYLYSSISQDINGIKSFVADFSKIGCTTCPNSLKITLIDYASSTLGATQTDSSFYVGPYNYATTAGIASRYSIAFTKINLGPPLSNISWDFGDGSSSTALNPTYTYVRPGKYDVCVDASFTGGCISTLCNTIGLGNQESFLETSLNASNPTGTSIDFSANGAAGVAPYQYFWDFGDGNTSTSQNITHNYSTEGVYTVAVTVRDAIGSEKTERQNVRTQNSSDCVARYNYVINPVANPDNLGNIIIEWRDANGVLYTSKNNSQPIKSFFKINSIEEYLPNENNQPTKKMVVTFSCVLYNGASEITLNNATAIIAMPY